MVEKILERLSIEVTIILSCILIIGIFWLLKCEILKHKDIYPPNITPTFTIIFHIVFFGIIIGCIVSYFKPHKLSSNENNIQIYPSRTALNGDEFEKHILDAEKSFDLFSITARGTVLHYSETLYKALEKGTRIRIILFNCSLNNKDNIKLLENSLAKAHSQRQENGISSEIFSVLQKINKVNQKANLNNLRNKIEVRFIKPIPHYTMWIRDGDVLLNDINSDKVYLSIGLTLHTNYEQWPFIKFRNSEKNNKLIKNYVNEFNSIWNDSDISTPYTESFECYTE